MDARLDKLSLVKDKDIVCRADGAKMMSDDKNCPVLSKIADGLLDFRFVDGVNIAGDLVQNNNGRVLQKRPGNGNPLLLPPERPTPFSPTGVSYP